MDEELRKAERIIHRSHGHSEKLLLDRYVAEIWSYLQAQELACIYVGCGHFNNTINTLSYEHRVMAARHVDFLADSSLDSKSDAYIMHQIFAASHWNDWFYLASYHHNYLGKDGSSIWHQILERDRHTEYWTRYKQSMSEWGSFQLVCYLRPRYSHGYPLHNWSAVIGLLGFNRHCDIPETNADTSEKHSL